MSLFTGSHLLCVRGGRAIFRELHFALDPGDALILSGANGSGKSSLLRLMGGLSKPWEGRLCWREVSIFDDPAVHARRLHAVGHAEGHKAVLTARENLAFWASFAAEAHVPRALEAWGIDSFADIPLRFLSAGQRRKIALARLGLDDRPLWLLDEPTVALDYAGNARLTALIAEHRAKGGMIVVATHTTLDLPGATTLSLADFAGSEGAA